MLAEGLSPAAEKKREALGALLRAVADYRGQPEVVAAMKLMAYLFPRPGELRMADWDEFDPEGPSRQTTSPRSTVRSTPFKTGVPLNLF